ncbi:MAG: hypothetical protein Q9179_005823, partial [Wetmoreana sp. 5 TL-2023]
MDGSGQAANLEVPAIHSSPAIESRPMTKALTEHAIEMEQTPNTREDTETAGNGSIDTIRSNGFNDENLLSNKQPDLPDSDEEDFQTNLYQDHADRIGLSHHLPGIGHLGDLLTPPGWKTGDEPIHPKQARQLHKESYEAARKTLSDSTAELNDLKGSAFQKACDLKDADWQNQTNLYKLIYEARVKVYWAHHDAKKQPTRQERTKQFPVLNLTESNGRTLPLRDLPTIIEPAARETYIRPHSQTLVVPCRRRTNGVDAPEPSPKILSPSFLDPNLIPGTVEAVIQGYHLRKAQLAHEARDNELRLRQCLIRYGPHLASQHLTPHLQAAQAEKQNESFFQNHPPQVQSRFGNGLGLGVENNGHQTEHNEMRTPTTYAYPEPPGQNALGIYDEPTELALISSSKSSPSKDNDEETTPRPTKRQVRTKSGSAKKPTPKKATPSK